MSTHHKPKAYIFIGRSGSGKGTQGARLVSSLKQAGHPEPLYVQTGSELREFIQKDSTFTQRRTKTAYENGALMPEFIAVSIWTNVLMSKFDGKQDIIFDGTPRKFHEAGVLNSVFDFYDFAEIYVIHIDISDEEAVKRLMGRGRMDDTEEDIKERLSWYKTEVVQTMEYFRDNPRYTFLTILGERPIDVVHEDIISAVGIGK
jgi:adenylate kinase